VRRGKIGDRDSQGRKIRLEFPGKMRKERGEIGSGRRPKRGFGPGWGSCRGDKPTKRLAFLRKVGGTWDFVPFRCSWKHHLEGRKGALTEKKKLPFIDNSIIGKKNQTCSWRKTQSFEIHAP